MEVIERHLVEHWELDSHWDSQFPRKSERMGANIPDFDFIVRQEFFWQDLSLVNKTLGYNYQPPKLNVTQFPKKYRSSNQFLGDTSTLELHDAGLHVTAANLIDDDIREHIQKIYFEDLTTLRSLNNAL